MQSQQSESWASGQKYEEYVGRWSRLVAPKFINWLAQPHGLRWLDAGCGTGVLVQTILDTAAPASVTGVDRSEPFIKHAQHHVQHERAQFQTADAQALPFEDHSFDTAVSGLVLNFVPEPNRMIGEMARVVMPGGTVALYVWDYSGEMQMMRRFWDAAEALDPAAEQFDEGKRFTVCTPHALSALFYSAGLHDVENYSITIPTIFRNFDDYWTPFLSGQAPAPRYTMSLGEEARAALRERLRSSLSTAENGIISLTARALAVRGRVPA